METDTHSQALLRHGANASSRNAAGQTPVQLCSLDPNNACLEVLTGESDTTLVDIDFSAPLTARRNPSVSSAPIEEVAEIDPEPVIPESEPEVEEEMDPPLKRQGNDLVIVGIRPEDSIGMELNTTSKKVMVRVN